VTRLIHVSDLHFGRHDPSVAEALLRDAERVRPDVVVVSGDLTQRARPEEFRAARAWIDRLPCPAVIVPGNHDLPLLDLPRRVARPFAGFRRHVRDDLEPVHRARDVVLVGVTTPRRTRWREGRIGVDQMERIAATLCPLPHFKVLVSHHPLVPTRILGLRPAVGRAARAVRVFDRCGLDLILAGHLHRGHVDDVGTHYEAVQSILVVHAGTAISLRRRGEANAYNVIDVDAPDVALQVRAWDGGAFRPAGERRFTKTDGQWSEVSSG
jgi:3',5'-cyclic AMP phosphodiesterase CpdA